MKIIQGQKFEEERSLYGLRDTLVLDCQFGGPVDGESPLKEGRDYEVKDCDINLRYPCWHAKNAKIIDSRFHENSRAPFWYCRDLTVEDCEIKTIKAFRECQDTKLNHIVAQSDEFFWRSQDTKVKDLKLEGVYAFFENEDLEIEGMDFKGKYSFQYGKNLVIKNSALDTKDAFWHVKGARIENCVLKGEYLAWYSEDLTFVNCRIEGTQPFVDCKGLRLINCEMHDTDLSFENSEVEAEVTTHLVSVKNPRKGWIKAPEIGQIIFDEFALPPRAKLIVGGKEIQ